MPGKKIRSKMVYATVLFEAATASGGIEWFTYLRRYLPQFWFTVTYLDSVCYVCELLRDQRLYFYDHNIVSVLGSFNGFRGKEHNNNI